MLQMSTAVGMRKVGMKEVFTFGCKARFEIAGSTKALEKAKAVLGSLVGADPRWGIYQPPRKQRVEDELIAFSRKGDQHAKDCILSIGHCEPNQLKMLTVVAQHKGDIIDDEAFKHVSREFFDCFVQSLDMAELVIHMPKNEIRIDEVLHADTARKLDLFTTFANENTGTSSSFDQPNWHEFVFAAAVSGCGDKFKPYIKEWFEANGWDADAAKDLAIEYEKDLSLVEFCRQKLRHEHR